MCRALVWAACGTCALAVPALLAVIGLRADDGAAQPGGDFEMEIIRG